MNRTMCSKIRGNKSRERSEFVVNVFSEVRKSKRRKSKLRGRSEFVLQIIFLQKGGKNRRNQIERAFKICFKVGIQRKITLWVGLKLFKKMVLILVSGNIYLSFIKIFQKYNAKKELNELKYLFMYVLFVYVHSI